jgi:hypothetical protein
MKKCSVFMGVVLIFLFLFPIICQAQNKYLVVSPGAIRPVDHNFASLDWYAYSNEFYYDTGFPDSVYGSAAVYLPQGATVKRFYAVITDNGSGIDEAVAVFISRQDLETGVENSLAYVSSDPLMPNPNRRLLQDNSINYATIDFRYTYVLKVRFWAGTPNVKFHGAIIVYEE